MRITWPPVIAGITDSTAFGAKMLGSSADSWFWGLLIATLMSGYAAWMKRHSVQEFKKTIVDWMARIESRQHPACEPGPEVTPTPSK